MMRSLWTAASGMRTQQTTIDVISNNFANVNTTGFKKEAAEFKSLLYQTIQSKTTSANGENKPIGAQVGLGVRNSAITSSFVQGNLTPSNNTYDFAINGDGFFLVKGQDGQTYYTRSGNFQVAMATNGTMLCTSDGLPVLDTNGKPIIFDSSINTSKITISESGEVAYPDEQNNPTSLGITIGIAQFYNSPGLEKIGSGLYRPTDASGEPLIEANHPSLKKSVIKQGYLESSNVQVVDEMVNLIVAQRAYEMNSKAIQSSDEMMSQANSLKR